MAQIDRPQARMSIYTAQPLQTEDADNIRIRPANYTFESPPNPSDDLLSVSVDRNINAWGGTWTAQFPWRRRVDNRRWSEILEPMDLVVIELCRPPEEGWHTVSIGFVEHISEQNTIEANGRPIRIATISGRDIGMIFRLARMEWWAVQLFGVTTTIPDAPVLAFLQDLKNLPTQSIQSDPHKIVQQIIEEILDRLVDFPVWIKGADYPVAQALLNYRLDSFTTRIPDVKRFDFKFLFQQQSVEELIHECASEPFNELFCEVLTEQEAIDTVPDPPYSPITREGTRITFGSDKAQFYLIMRERPFPRIRIADGVGSGNQAPTGPPPQGTVIEHDRELWDALKAITITDSDEMGGDPFVDLMSRSAADQRNVFLGREMVFRDMGGLAYWLAPLVIDLDRIRRYGLRPRDVATHLMLNKTRVDDVLRSLQQNLAWRLASYGNLEDNFWAGRQTMKLLPQVKLGMKLLDHRSLISEQRHYYIEGYSHQANWLANRWTTTLTLTRGLSAERYDTIEFQGELNVVQPPWQKGILAELQFGLVNAQLYNGEWYSLLATPQYNSHRNPVYGPGY